MGSILEKGDCIYWEKEFKKMRSFFKDLQRCTITKKDKNISEGIYNKCNKFLEILEED